MTGGPVAAGVSFVIPVCNGECWLPDVLEAIARQTIQRPIEIIAIDDDSRDGSREILAQWEADGRLRVLRGSGSGAAAAINQGILAAKHPLVAQVDQDVVLEGDWLEPLVEMLLSDQKAAAVQGCYHGVVGGPLVARTMDLDLRLRYHDIASPKRDHVCTGNSVYRRDAIIAVGLFDESLGYGYDNDMSYRLVAAGYRLSYCKEARSTHHWRADLASYLRQQYGLGYGRLDLVAKHPRRVGGDDVSGILMMAHAPLFLVALAVACGSLATQGAEHALVPAGAILTGLALERFVAGVRAWFRFGDPAGLLFAPLHLARDAAWALAIVVWLVRRVTRHGRLPKHSMGRPKRARS